jgi:hexosaminidase
MTHKETMTRFDTLLPRPHSVSTGQGNYVLPETPRVHLPDAALRRAIALLPVMPVFVTDGRADITVTLDAHLPTEGYRLSITPDAIAITTAGAPGLCAAVQTLRQLLPTASLRARVPDGLALTLPCGDITDAPAFRWRGALLDPARHFIPKTELLRQIDALALHKINRLQLHLTDEQGWRVESLRFPRLTGVGASRRRTQITHFLDQKAFEDIPHGGFYTQDDIREICAYAADRGITVVPEIELPGHTGALLAAYPDLGSPPDVAREVLGTWGIHDTVVAPIGATVAFFTELFAELAGLFPGPWLHVGGDESLPDAWARDVRVQAEAADKGLTTPAAIYADFMAQIATAVRAAGKTMITWDDSFATSDTTGKTDTTTAIMCWRGMEVARRAAAAGHDVILTPIMPTYFDYSQSGDLDERLSIGGPVTLDDVAGWTPIPPGWSDTQRAFVLGIQCQVWSEFIPDPHRIDYMLYPRLPVFADVAWVGQGRGMADTLPRLAAHMDRLAALGLDACPLDGPQPWQKAGIGRYAHFPLRAMTEVMAQHEEGAELGITPFGVNE